MKRPICLDVTRSVVRRMTGQTPSGIDRVCDAYAIRFADDAYAAIQIRGRLIVLDRSASRQFFAEFDAPVWAFRLAMIVLLLKLPFCLAKRRDLARTTYLNVSHTDFDLDRHWRSVRELDFKPFYLLHDLIPITHPHVTTPHKSARHRGRVIKALEYAAGIIANSQATAGELREFAGGEELSVPPLLVAPIAAAQVKTSARKDHGRNRVFVSVGTVETRKNHVLLLRAWSLLIDRLGDLAPRLVIAGNLGLGSELITRSLARDPRLRDFVEIQSDQSDAEIARLVAEARAMLLPTLAEGYGLPMVEALAQGVPVIASDLPSFREIGQGIPTLLDPNDTVSWANTVASFCEESSERARQLAAMDHFRAPTWSAHFAELDAWLNALHGERVAPERAESCAEADIGLYEASAESRPRGQQAQC